MAAIRGQGSCERSRRNVSLIVASARRLISSCGFQIFEVSITGMDVVEVCLKIWAQKLSLTDNSPSVGGSMAPGQSGVDDD